MGPNSTNNKNMDILKTLNENIYKHINEKAWKTLLVLNECCVFNECHNEFMAMYRRHIQLNELSKGLTR